MYLNCKTFFSLRYGTYSTEQLVDAAVDAGATALALTDINTTGNTWNFVKLCRERGINPICGAEIRNGDDLCYILLAANNTGFAWINRFISEHLCSGRPFPKANGAQPFFNDTWDGYVIYPLGTKPALQLHINEMIGIKPSQVNKLYSIAGPAREKMVVLQPVTFQNRIYHDVHRLLRAVDHNVVHSKLPANAVCALDEYFIKPFEIIDAFKQYPFVLTNTFRLMDSCHIKMDFEIGKNKKTFTGTLQGDHELLRKLADAGFKEHYGNNKKAASRLETEMKIIFDMGFTGYFLMVWDLLRFADSQKYLHIGRGSGANSIVAYCLGISQVDPIEHNLFFERFLNPERTSPPDFDLDFSHNDVNDMFDYLFKRYPRGHVALMGAMPTFQFNAIIRELGKVYGLPKEEIDQLGEKGYYYKEARHQNFDKRDAENNYHELILRYGKLISNFPNIQSVHSCGIVVTEEPVYAYTSCFMPPKGMVTTHIDMYQAESISLEKFDILSQMGLAHLKTALEIIKENRDKTPDVHHFPLVKKDRGVKENMREANTIGCFYIESPAMRQLLGKLHCDTYETLVVASSIIRPGVASSGMMREYILRHHDHSKASYLHPKMKALLEETYGVMVFQEDVMRVGHEVGGLTLAEADTLRRAMSGKYKSNNRFELMKQKYFDNCKAAGIPGDTAEEIWRQMESFAGYSFCKAHSASFARLSMKDLYLKTHYPAEFMVSVINNQGGFYSTEVYFIELRKTGVNVHLPCVNQSEFFTRIDGQEVFAGIGLIGNVPNDIKLAVVANRIHNGPYQHLQDLVERTGITAAALNTLISAGALRFTGKSKKRLLWEANFLQSNIRKHKADNTLFKEEPVQIELPELFDNALDDCYDEMEIFGFPFRDPFELCDKNPFEFQLAKDLKENLGKQVKMLLYYIDYKAVITKHLASMSFGTFLDAGMTWVDTVHFPDSLQKYPLRGRGFYLVTGKVVEDFGVYSVEVHYQQKIGYKQRKYANL